MKITNLLILSGFALLGSSASAQNQWSTNASNVFYNTGSVGIGTSTPSSKLHIKTNPSDGGGVFSSTPLLVERDGGTSASQGTFSVFISDFNDGTGDAILQSGLGRDIALRSKEANGTQHHLILTDNGNVGIGTTNPGKKLTVVDGDISIVEGPNNDAPGINFGQNTTNSGGQMGLEYLPGEGLNVWTPYGSENGFENYLFFVKENGDVGIGTDLQSNTAGYKLSVDGSIRAKELVVELGWADYVFEKEYSLSSLDSVELYINKNGHLPNTPTAAEVENGEVGLGELTKIQQEKIEELTLYLIQLKKEIAELKSMQKF